MRLLAAGGTPLRGARAVVLGRSAIVGRPMAALLLAADATVTIAHSHTLDIAAECRRADVRGGGGGTAGNGARRLDQARRHRDRRGHQPAWPDGRLVGDVAYAECAAVAGAITPVPGGVGPMTIACLLDNTVKAALRRRSTLV